MAEPTDVAGLLGQYRAEGKGANNALFPQWIPDVSTTAPTVAQGTSSQQPVFRAGVLGANARAAVDFDGTDDRLEAADSNIGRNLGAVTMYCVVRCDTASGVRGIFAASTGASSNAARFYIRTDSGVPTMGGRRLDSDSFQTISGSGSIVDGKAHVITAIFDYANSNAYLYVDGNLKGSTTTFQTSGNTSDTNALAVKMGSNSSGQAEFWDGYISEVLVYSGAHSAADRSTIHTYIADDYGVAVSDAQAPYVAPASGGGRRVLQIIGSGANATDISVYKARAEAEGLPVDQADWTDVNENKIDYTPYGAIYHHARYAKSNATGPYVDDPYAAFPGLVLVTHHEAARWLGYCGASFSGGANSTAATIYGNAADLLPHPGGSPTQSDITAWTTSVATIGETSAPTNAKKIIAEQNNAGRWVGFYYPKSTTTFGGFGTAGIRSCLFWHNLNNLTATGSNIVEEFRTFGFESGVLILLGTITGSSVLPRTPQTRRARTLAPPAGFYQQLRVVTRSSGGVVTVAKNTSRMSAIAKQGTVTTVGGRGKLAAKITASAVVLTNELALTPRRLIARIINVASIVERLALGRAYGRTGTIAMAVRAAGLVRVRVRRGH